MGVMGVITPPFDFDNKICDSVTQTHELPSQKGGFRGGRCSYRISV